MFLVDLAIVAGKKPVTLKEINLRHKISQKYLWQIADALKAAGLVRSVAGSRGGYVLVRNADQISLKTVLDAVEGNESSVPASLPRSGAESSVKQAIRQVVGETMHRMNGLMDEVTLTSILDKEYEIRGSAAADYVI